MNKTIIASTIFALCATSVAALDLGNAAYLDNTVETVYSVENQKLTATYEGELGYTFDYGITAYAEFNADIIETEHLGSEIGVRYEPASAPYLTATTAVTFDTEYEYSDVELRLELNF